MFTDVFYDTAKYLVAYWDSLILTVIYPGLFCGTY